MKQFALIVTDSGPLITLGVADALDALLAPKLSVIIPDMVRFEVIRDLSKPGAQQVADWIRAHQGQNLRVRRGGGGHAGRRAYWPRPTSFCDGLVCANGLREGHH